MSNDNQTLLDLQEEINTIGLGRIGLNETNSTKFNFATIDKTEDDIQYIEYWILANASYDSEAERFIKIDATATSFGIQIQAKGTYPGEEEFDTKNTGVNIWRNPPKADVTKDTSTYDYSDWTDNNYIGAERRSDNVWVEFGISAGWTNNLMTDSYGGVTIGGSGIEIDGSGLFPFTRVTNSSFNDGTNTYYIMGMLDNAYHPNGTTWKCDSNEKGAWFFGLKYPQTSGAKDSANAKFVVLYNDMSSIDPSATGYTIEDMDISDWETILEVSSSSIKGMVSGTLTTLGGSGGGSFDLIDSITDGDTTHAVTPNAVYDALLTKNITLTKQATAELGYAATYVLSQGGTAISPKINIPKDFLVKSASVKTCTTDDDPVTGYVVGDKYLDFVVNSVDNDDTASHIYLKVTELVDVYSADNSTLELGTGNVFKIKDGGVTFAKIASSAIGTGANQIAAGNHTHTIPSPSSATPSADVSGGAVGSSSDYAKADHQHPLSSAYAEAGHNHDSRYYTETEVDNIVKGLLNRVSVHLSAQVIQVDDTVSFTAYLLKDGVPLAGETVQLYGSNDTLIGSMTDNSDGTYSYTYTGVGAGVKGFYAKCGSIQSGTCNVWDCLFYDSGVTGTPQNQYVVTENRIKKEVTDNGTVVTQYNDSPSYGHLFIKEDSQYFNYPLRIEFDLVELNRTQYFSIYDYDGEGRVHMSNTGHYIIEINSNGVISATCNGNNVTIDPQNPITQLMRLSFFVVGVNETMTFKNLKIYPI